MSPTPRTVTSPRTDVCRRPDPHGAAFPARLRSRGLAVVVTLAFVPLLPALLRLAGLLVPGVDGSPFASPSALLVTAAHDALALVVVAGLVALLGGARGVLTERHRLRTRVGVVALLGYVALSLARALTPVAPGSADYLLALCAAVTAVALVEELTFRGVLVAGLRRAAPEWVVWLVSTVTFALAHLVGGEGSAYQVATTLLVGSACYLARRVTGSLLGPVVLHALYDAFLGFRTQTVEGVPPLLTVGATGSLVAAAVLGLVAAIRRGR